MTKKVNEDVFNKILSHISNGFSLKGACEDLGLHNRQFYTYMYNTEGAERKYARACEERSEFKVSEMHDIADREPDVQRAKLKIDVIKWEAAKLKPKKYGDVSRHEHTGKDGEDLSITIKTKV